MSFRQGTGGKITQEVWEAIGIDGAEDPKIQDDPDIQKTSVDIVELPNGLAAAVADEEIVEQPDALLDPPFGTPTTITFDPKARLVPNAAGPSIAEDYRRLRTQITQQQSENPFRSLVVTSAGPREGKTVTVLNLGLSLAMLPSFRVLVMDGDLRKGTLGSWLGVDHQHPGLSNLIDGSAQLDEVVLKSDGISMDVIVAGNRQVPDLESADLTSHFQRLTELYDLVLVDSPPVNLIADVQLLAASCDAVMLVARAYTTSQKAFKRAIQELSRFRVVGTVLNAGSSQHYRYDKEYY